MQKPAVLYAGASKVDITPDIQKIRLQLGGYGARLNMPPVGVHDPIYARALALRWGEQQAVIVALDHLLAPGSLTRAVLKATGLQPPQLFLAASHTHCAPDAMGMNERMRFPIPGVATFEPEFLRFTTERVSEAIRQARARLQPARLALHAEPIAGLNRNRRGQGITDPTMTVVRVSTPTNKPIALLVIYAAHPTIYSHTMMEVSAEFPGVLQSGLEAVLGDGVVALYLNGAQGDVSPVADEGKTDHERVQRYGNRLKAHALRLLQAVKPTRPRLSTHQQMVPLPSPRPHPEFQQSAGREYKVPESLLSELVRQIVPSQAPVSLLVLGNLLLVGFPGEPITALGLEARRIGQAHGFRYIAPVALVNDWIGYILTREEYERGGYEATVSFNGPELGDAILAGVQQGIASINPRSRR
ncbi:MAG: neutral/alkaline non-lysosomal ceramidase N-terminal domain-containing protein [Fimbriimonadales bacterium]|nr:neutral/alkaline non-lysosomal ceramidase N-terminal domain-containing protein [Fimbriimonadales bacterium]